MTLKKKNLFFLILFQLSSFIIENHNKCVFVLLSTCKKKYENKGIPSRALTPNNFTKGMALPKVGSLSSLYAWFRLHIDYKVPESILTVIPNGLASDPNPHPLQAQMKRVRFEWEHFPITMQRLLPHEIIRTMNSWSAWLAIAMKLSRERSQHFLLKGTELGCRAYVMQNARECVRKTNDSYSQAKQ